MASDQVPPAIRQTQTGNQAHPSGERPYRWGKAQAWLCIVGGLLSLLLSVVLLFMKNAAYLRVAAYTNIVASTVCAAAGFGLLKKRIYGLVFFDIYLIYWCVTLIAKYLRFEYNTLQMVIGLVSTGLMAAYTNKRFREFR